MLHLPRREKVSSFVRENDLEGFLVTSEVNVTYLTGFSGDSSNLLIGRDRILLVSDGRYTEQLREECPGVPLHIRPPAVSITSATAEAISKLGWRQVGFESEHLTVAELDQLKEAVPAVNWKPCKSTVETLRMVKDDDEIGQIKEAIGMAERAFARFKASLKPADTEKQLSDRMEMLVREEGASCSSFPTIVGVGERAALPHAPLTSRRIGDGELVLIDWGAAGRFYKSDLTRVLTRRKILPKLASVYEVVLGAQARAIAKIRPGVKAHDVDAEARSAIEDAGFGEFFSHGLGHGIGLEIHEGPRIRPDSDIVLQPGMVFTVEPGIYLPGLGGVRIEDDVRVTPDGCEVLTSAEKDFRVSMLDF